MSPKLVSKLDDLVSLLALCFDCRSVLSGGNPRLCLCNSEFDALDLAGQDCAFLVQLIKLGAITGGPHMSGQRNCFALARDCCPACPRLQELLLQLSDDLVG